MLTEPSTKTFKVARRLLRAGVSVIPIQPASKSPAVSAWKPYQTHIADEERLPEWFSNGNGIAIIGGAVSGNLLIIDFDHPGIYEQFRQMCDDNGIDEIEQCAVARTPSGGNHVYLCAKDPIGPSDKLAQQTFDIPTGTQEVERRGQRYAKIGSKEYLIVSVDSHDRYLKCVIETRGEGGYAVTWPSPGYELFQGRTDQLPVFSAESVSRLLHIAEQFNTYSPPEQYPAEPARNTGENAGRNTPGNDYNARGDYEQVLIDHGWQPLHRSGPKTTWVRPGKDEREVSATSGHEGARMFYVFSTNAAPFEPGRKYSPFAVYTLLEHAGDFTAAALALVANGFGEPPNEKFKMPRAKKKTVADREAEAESAANDQSKQYLYALAWAQLNKDRFIYLNGDQWFEYREGYWRYSSSEKVQRSIQEYLATVTSVTAALVGNVRTLAKSMLGPYDLTDFNAQSNWIPLRNGVLDTLTGQLLPHLPENRVTYQAPYDYIPDADCPTWMRFLDECLIDANGLPSRDWQEALQEWFGYCLIPDNTAQLSMMWVGEGANGKGCATRLLEQLVGKEFTTSIPIEQLHDPYHRAELYGKLVGFVNEPDPRAMMKNGNHFKAIVGGDSISARRPTEKVFTFTPMTRLVISCNDLPANKDMSRGYYRRIVLIEWRYNVPVEKRDPELDDKMRSELPGILNWALVGLARWRARGRKFIVPEESGKLLEAYRLEQDTLRKFLQERCIKSDSIWCANSIFYNAYKQACEEWGDRPEPGKSVAARLAKMGYRSDTQRDAGKVIRVYRGVDLDGGDE